MTWEQEQQNKETFFEWLDEHDIDYASYELNSIEYDVSIIVTMDSLPFKPIVLQEKLDSLGLDNILLSTWIKYE